MKFEETIQNKLTSETVTYPSFDSKQEGALCLYDPITQICKRIEAFFDKDPSIHCSFVVNNNKRLGPMIDPDTGEQMTRMITIDGESVNALLEQNHYCEFRIFCDDYEKAQNLSNVIRHRHTFTETYEGASDGEIHVRDHILIVRVMVLHAVDPDGPGGGTDPWIADDNSDPGIEEIFGLEPVDWNDTEGNGCYERLAPSDTSESDIPKGFPEEWEQRQWEMSPLGPGAWKWIWLKKALKGNKNIIRTNKEFSDGINQWRFIECSDRPAVFQEDNLTSYKGYNSILPADLLPLVFSIFNGYQISTYVK